MEADPVKWDFKASFSSSSRLRPAGVRIRRAEGERSALRALSSRALARDGGFKRRLLGVAGSSTHVTVFSRATDGHYRGENRLLRVSLEKRYQYLWGLCSSVATICSAASRLSWGAALNPADGCPPAGAGLRPGRFQGHRPSPVGASGGAFWRVAGGWARAAPGGSRLRPGQHQFSPG